MVFGCTYLCPGRENPPLRNKELGVAVLTPDKQTIVFSVLSESHSNLYKACVDGTGLAPITVGPTYDFDPAVSPDGTAVAFSHISDGNGDICVIRMDGTGNHCITSGPSHDYNPAYSSDGKTIFFLRAEIYTNYSPIAHPAWHDVDIYSVNSDGKELTRITAERNYKLNDLSINGTGDTLMVMAGTHEDSPFWLIPVKAPVNKRIIRPNLENHKKSILFWKANIDYTQLRNPQLSPDGTKILFTWPYHEALFVMDLKNDLVERIWKWDKDNERWPGRMYPRFSHDGQQITFNAISKVPINLFCMTGMTFKDSLRQVWEDPDLMIINVDGTGFRSVNVK